MPDKPQTFAPSLPEKEQIKLVIDGQFQIERFTEYSFSSEFLQPTDGWSFTIGAEELSDDETKALKTGASVQLIVNDQVLSAGYIDAITCEAQRGSGLEYKVEGRDRLSRAVDACADPTSSLKENQTLADALQQLFKPYGWSNEDQFVIDASADRNIRTNRYRSKTKKSEAKGFGRRALKQYKIHQLRPYPREGVFEFASRLAHRFGLHIWLSPDGEALYVSTPDFAQEPSYRLVRNTSGETNVLSGSVKRSLQEQPSHIIADGYSGGGEFGKSRMVVIMFNNTVSMGSLPLPPDIKKYEAAGAKFIEGPTFPFDTLPTLSAWRPSYLHDDESQTFEHLEAFVRREMSLLQRKSLEASYEVEGHGQTVDGNFVPWVIDTVVHVKDSPAGIEEDLYVQGVHYKKTRNAGTTTSLSLIRLNTLVFSDTDQKKR